MACCELQPHGSSSIKEDVGTYRGDLKDILRYNHRVTIQKQKNSGDLRAILRYNHRVTIQKQKIGVSQNYPEI